MKALIIGAGPSLEENLDKIKDFSFFDYIICTDGAVNKVLERGIIPDYVTTLEDTPDLDKYYNTDVMREKAHLIGKAYISDRVDANVIKAMKSVGLEVKVASNTSMFLTSNVGLFSWFVSFLELNCDEAYLIGMDHCYPIDDGPPVDRDSEIFKYGFQVLINPYNYEDIILNPAHQLWREEFVYYSNKFKDRIKTINLTGRGALFGKNIIWEPDYLMKN